MIPALIDTLNCGNGHLEDGAVDLIGAGKVFVGGGDDRAVGILQPVKPRLEPFHRDAAQIDDVVAHRAFVGGDQGVHHVPIL